MVKKGCIKCEKCGKMVSKKGLSAHKCAPSKPKVPSAPITCLTCKTPIKPENFKMHQKRCDAKALFLKHKPFFKWLARLVRAHNREIDLAIKRERRKQAFELVVETFQDEPEYIQNDLKDLIEVAMDDLRRKGDIRALKEANEAGIVISKSLPLEIIKEVYGNHEPKISVRQVILKYLKDNGLYNQYIKFWVCNGLKKGDYLTDEEFYKDNRLFSKLQTLRVYTDYKIKVAPFYQLISDQFNDVLSHKCPFCDKFVQTKRRHLKTCSIFQKLFKEDRGEAITRFIKTFYKQWITKEIDLEYFVRYYTNTGNFSYFYNTIDTHIADKVQYREKIFKGKQSVLSPANLGTAKDLVKEVNDWKPLLPLVKRSFESEEPVYSPLISEKEDNEEEEEEEVINTDKPIYDKNVITAKGFFKFKIRPLPKDYKSEGEEEDEDSKTLKEDKKEMKRYFTDLNNHFNPKKEPKDDGEYDLLDLDLL